MRVVFLISLAHHTHQGPYGLHRIVGAANQAKFRLAATDPLIKRLLVVIARYGDLADPAKIYLPVRAHTR